MPTKVELSDSLDRVVHDLEASEAVVEKQIMERKRLLDKYRNATQSIADLKGRNKVLVSQRDTATHQLKIANTEIVQIERQNDGLVVNVAHKKTIILEAEAAMELGLRLFYPEALADQDLAKDPKARLFLRVFDILGKSDA